MRHSTCCRRSTPATTARCPPSTPTARPTRSRGSRRSCCSPTRGCRSPRCARRSSRASTRWCSSPGGPAGCVESRRSREVVAGDERVRPLFGWESGALVRRRRAPSEPARRPDAPLPTRAGSVLTLVARARRRARVRRARAGRADARSRAARAAAGRRGHAGGSRTACACPLHGRCTTPTSHSTRELRSGCGWSAHSLAARSRPSVAPGMACPRCSRRSSPGRSRSGSGAHGASGGSRPRCRARSSRWRPSCGRRNRRRRGRPARWRRRAGRRRPAPRARAHAARPRARRRARGLAGRTRRARRARRGRCPGGRHEPSADAAADAIDGLASSLRHRLDASAEARALSAQSRLSAIVVGAAPIGYLAFSGLVDPGLGALVVGTGVGRVCLVVGLALEGLAALWIRRIVRSEA